MTGYWQFVKARVFIDAERRVAELLAEVASDETAHAVFKKALADRPSISDDDLATSAIIRRITEESEAAIRTCERIRAATFQVRSAPSAKIAMPPGYRADRVLRFLFKPRAYEKIYRPIVADMQHEHAEAFVTGNMWLARWRHWQGWIAIVIALVTHVWNAVRPSNRTAQ